MTAIRADGKSQQTAKRRRSMDYVSLFFLDAERVTVRHELLDLIDRMTADEKTISSHDSISWHAHREAERLSDESLLGELDAYLAGRHNKDKRMAAYFIIGKIGKNCRSSACASLLITYAPKEKEKYALGSLLQRLADIPKPADVDIGPLLLLLKDERWLVRHSAINSLQGCESAQAEDELLNVLAVTRDPYDAVYCHAVLNRIGTPNALPALALNAKSRKRDVKESARAAILAIEARHCSS